MFFNFYGLEQPMQFEPEHLYYQGNTEETPSLLNRITIFMDIYKQIRMKKKEGKPWAWDGRNTLAVGILR
jgi:hypothetical protein